MVSNNTLAGGQKSLRYRYEEAYLTPVATSPLSDFNMDFDTASARIELYNLFYDYLSEEQSQNSDLSVFSNGDGFCELKDDVYYAVYDFGIYTRI